MSISVPRSKFIRVAGPSPVAEVFVPCTVLPDGSRVFLRHQSDAQLQGVALPRGSGVPQQKKGCLAGCK